MSKPKRQPGSRRTKTKGAWKLERPDRPNPHGVQWRENVFDSVTGTAKKKTKTLFFPTAESRDGKFSELLSAKRSGMMQQSASRSELEEFRQFKAAVEGERWQNVVAGWRAHLMSQGIEVCSITIKTAVTDYLAKMEQLKESNKISKDTYRQKKHKLTLFSEDYGTRTLGNLNGQTIENWIDSLEEVQTDLTFDDYLKHIRAFFGFWIKQKKAIRTNPCEQISRRHDGIGHVATITPKQCAKLFATALDYRDDAGNAVFMPAIGRLALEAFIGMRFGSAAGIKKDDINFKDKGVTLQRYNIKTRRRYYIDGLPEQLWDWLAIAPKECWALTRRQYLELKSNLFTVAGVSHPANCLRHSFATHDIALHKNPGRTATILCHRDQDELWEHYLGIATSEQGKLYQTITPRTAAAICG